MHFLQYLNLGFTESESDPDCCRVKIGLPYSDFVKGMTSALSSSIPGLQFRGTVPGSVSTTEK